MTTQKHMRNKLYIKTFCISLAMALLSVGGHAQQTIRGSVKDSAGEPLAGVSVVVKGTGSGTVSSSEGDFSISVPEPVLGKTLIFSFIGFRTDSVVLSGQARLNVILNEESELLEEVVAIGYQTVRKSDLTGAVSSVNIDKTEALQISTFDQLLQGKAAGVQVTSGNSAPGGAVSVVIRGNSSFSGGGEPLYVVDGVILNSPTRDVSSTMGQSGGSAQDAQSGLEGISPADIASMEILKDASATAIYGSLGANGVVLITTKRGVSERPQIEVNSSSQVSWAYKQIPIIDAAEYFQWRKTLAPTTFSPAFNSWKQWVYNNVDGVFDDSYEPVYWQDYIMRASVSQRHRVTISGRSKTTDYYVAAGYRDEQGIIKGTYARSADVRMNLTKTINKFIKIGTNTSYSYGNYSMTQGLSLAQASTSSMISSMLYFVPRYNFRLLGVYDEITDEAEIEYGLANGPPMWLNDYSDKSYDYRLSPSLNAEVTLHKRLGLTYNFLAGMDYRYKTRERWRGKLASRNYGGVVSVADMESYRYNIDNTINLNRNFGAHRINAMLGFTISENGRTNTTAQVEGISVEDARELAIDNGTLVTTNNYAIEMDRLASLFGRGIYTFKNRYSLTMTYRADGSSKFARGNKFSYFPSMAFAWSIDRENFMSSLRRRISTLKLRAGWGKVGNQAVANYATLSTYGGGMVYGDHYVPALKVTGVRASRMPTPELMWETSEQYNLGLDLGLFRNRFSLTVETYYKTTDNLLQSLGLAPSSGWTSMLVNRGKILNKGLEITLDARVVSTRDFVLRLGGNLSFNRNTILDIGLPPDENGNPATSLGSIVTANGISLFGQPANIFIQGKPMAVFWGFKTDGIVQVGEPNGPDFSFNASNPESTPGSIRYVDIDGDNVITMADRQIIGSPFPKFSGGFDIRITYKNLSMVTTFYGVYGNQIANGNLMAQQNTSRVGAAPRREVFYDTWSDGTSYAPNPASATFGSSGFVSYGEPNFDAKYPRLTDGKAEEVRMFSDRIIEDGSFLRLSSLRLAYNFPVKNSKWIKSARINVTGNNLFVFTKYSGWDPEVDSFVWDVRRKGIDWNSYPRAKSVTIGLSIIM